MLPNSRYMVYRVMGKDTLTKIADAIGAPVLEAARIPGRERSYFRAWNTAGECWQLQASGEKAFVPVRASQFDRKVA